ncbi:MAG: hypothetical protein IJ629_03675 [Clostridia bacterium]|nr:hypothetical protein [Clostridia bacterium]
MLAKWWKKIALAICVIAILFNVTYKLVHRTNLKAELDAVRGEEAIKFSEDDRNTSVVDEGK